VSATSLFDIYIMPCSSSPGCLLCHCALLPCQEGIKEYWQSKPHDERQAALDWLQSYPDNEEEVLSTWETRTALWEGFKPLMNGRKYDCRIGKGFLPMKVVDADLY
jgi:hypothetical protein